MWCRVLTHSTLTSDRTCFNPRRIFFPRFIFPFLWVKNEPLRVDNVLSEPDENSFDLDVIDMLLYVRYNVAQNTYTVTRKCKLVALYHFPIACYVFSL
jgi:hypothetical protein